MLLTGYTAWLRLRPSCCCHCRPCWSWLRWGRHGLLLQPPGHQAAVPFQEEGCSRSQGDTQRVHLKQGRWVEGLGQAPQALTARASTHNAKMYPASLPRSRSATKRTRKGGDIAQQRRPVPRSSTAYLDHFGHISIPLPSGLCKRRGLCCLGTGVVVISIFDANQQNIYCACLYLKKL